ncbi:Aste57867_11521 [Aphanomyces stellatus]|uniref:Aste57867_11521 protein n=1 Tax=Aphanomyces stellatus TaxID=120398 RepID=A0A485KUC9_9STRA|nr:hypothetical protein As57867_011478 [Aphanomyces stellatus]VFT88382.1 Aste57867_11521 [Aphanomyces stellatus]
MPTEDGAHLLARSTTLHIDDGIPCMLDQLVHMVKLGLPIGLLFFMEILYFPISLGLAGHLPASNPPQDTKLYVDAVALASTYSTISCYAIGLGLGGGLDTLANQAHGAGNYAKMGVYLQSAILGTLLMFVPVVVANAFCGDVLLLFGVDPRLAALAGQYMHYLTFSLPFYFVYDLVQKLLQAHDIATPMLLVAFLHNVVHVVLGLYFTRSLNMGFHGVALAGCVAYMSYPILQVIYLVTCNPVYKAWRLQWNPRPAVAHLGEFYKLGLPGMGVMVIEFGALSIVGFLASTLPNSLVIVGANTVLHQSTNVIIVLCFGLSVATTVHMGNAIGANQLARAKGLVHLSLAVTTVSVAVSATLLYVLRFDIAKLFFTDPVVCSRAASALVYAIPYHIFDSYNIVWQSMLRACGEQRLAVLVNTVAYYVVGLPVAGVLAFRFEWNLEGLWIGLTVGAFSASVAYMVCMMHHLSWEHVLAEANARTTNSDDKLLVNSQNPPVSASSIRTSNMDSDDAGVMVYSGN